MKSMSAHENVAALASYPYPDVSLSKKICAQGKAVFSLSHGPLHFVTIHSRVARVSRLPLCEKRSA